MLIGKTFRNTTLELSDQRIVKPVDVDNNYGQVVIAELFQRQNLQKFFKRSETAAESNKSIASAFHKLFAFVHCCGLDAFGAVFKINPRNIELFGNYADDLSACGICAAGSRTHQPGSPCAENHTVTVRCKTMPELFGKFDITLGDVAA